MTLLSKWIFSVMLAIAPPSERKGIESEEQMKVRYEQIANDMEEVINSSEPIFSGEDNNIKLAALITSISFFESGFHKMVDNGKIRGDNGKSWCLMQINIGNSNVLIGTDEMKKWSGKDLVSDRKKCFKAGIEAIRNSLNKCSYLKEKDKLSAYTSGKCINDEKKGQYRWLYSQSLIKKYPLPENNLIDSLI